MRKLPGLVVWAGPENKGLEDEEKEPKDGRAVPEDPAAVTGIPKPLLIEPNGPEVPAGAELSDGKEAPNDCDPPNEGVEGNKGKADVEGATLVPNENPVDVFCTSLKVETAPEDKAGAGLVAASVPNDEGPAVNCLARSANDTSFEGANPANPKPHDF